MTMVANGALSDKNRELKYESPCNPLTSLPEIQSDTPERNEKANETATSSPTMQDLPPKESTEKTQKSSSQYHSIQKLCTSTSLPQNLPAENNANNIFEAPKTFNAKVESWCAQKAEKQFGVAAFQEARRQQEGDMEAIWKKMKNDARNKYMKFEENLERARKEIDVLKKDFERFLLETHKEGVSIEGGLESREVCILVGLLRRELSRKMEEYVEVVLEQFAQRHSAKEDKSSEVHSSHPHLYSPLINNFINRSSLHQHLHFPMGSYQETFKKNPSLYHFNPAFYFNQQQSPINPFTHHYSLLRQPSSTTTTTTTTTIDNPSSSEPEQTEALPLLVSSKRKRMKVIDSPKTSSYEQVSPGDFRRDEEVSECDDFSPLGNFDLKDTTYPSPLPTSVAILNPSITHPEFFNAIYQRKHYANLNFNSVYDKSGLSQCKRARHERKEEVRRGKFSEAYKQETALNNIASSSLLESQFADQLMISFVTPTVGSLVWWLVV